MPTTVRVEDDVKREFDRFQGHLQAETGERLSHSELLERLVRFARAHEAGFLEQRGESWRPPTRPEMERHFALVKDWGVETDVTKLDEELYGGSPHE